MNITQLIDALGRARLILGERDLTTKDGTPVDVIVNYTKKKVWLSQWIGTEGKVAPLTGAEKPPERQHSQKPGQAHSGPVSRGK